MRSWLPADARNTILMRRNVMPANLLQVAEETKRVERHWIKGEKRDLIVYRIALQHLYFNIENGRYADRMIRLKQENKGVHIDERQEKWKCKIEEMLAGEHKDTTRDKSAFEKLLQDIRDRDQLRPGVVLLDGGVIDGNRRFAALRRLSRESQNASRFGYFDAVILPQDTTDEDRWFIEAGIQLGIPERLDYTPINELLKVRQGILLYQSKIEDGSLGDTESPVKHVAKALYGRSEADVREMFQRLSLIDEYLESTGRPQAYDEVGPQSEDFLEATKIMAAAENQQRDPAFMGKLKHVLFYLIHKDLMDNKQLRQIRQALGRDPKKKGRSSKRVNMPALEELLNDFPDARDIRNKLAEQTSESQTKETGAGSPKKAKQHGKKSSLDPSRVEAGAQRFLRRMEATGTSKAPRTIAEGVKAELEALETSLNAAETRSALSVDDRAAITESLDSMERSTKNCRKHLKGS
jgi:hypothetical protein